MCVFTCEWCHHYTGRIYTATTNTDGTIFKSIPTFVPYFEHVGFHWIQEK